MQQISLSVPWRVYLYLYVCTLLTSAFVTFSFSYKAPIRGHLRACTDLPVLFLSSGRLSFFLRLPLVYQSSPLPSSFFERELISPVAVYFDTLAASTMTKQVTGHHRWKLVHCKKTKTKENVGKRFAFQQFEMDTIREKETSLTFVSKFGVNFRHDLAVVKKVSARVAKRDSRRRWREYSRSSLARRVVGENASSGTLKASRWRNREEFYSMLWI